MELTTGKILVIALIITLILVNANTSMYNFYLLYLNHHSEYSGASQICYYNTTTVEGGYPFIWVSDTFYYCGRYFDKLYYSFLALIVDSIPWFVAAVAILFAIKDATLQKKGPEEISPWN